MRALASDTVHWEYTGTDSNTVQTVLVYDNRGTVITVAANEQLFITSFKLLIGGTGVRADLFIDFNGTGTVTAGDRLVGGTFAANGIVAMDISESPRAMTKGSNLLKLLSAAAVQVDVVAHGYRMLA